MRACENTMEKLMQKTKTMLCVMVASMMVATGCPSDPDPTPDAGPVDMTPDADVGPDVPDTDVPDTPPDLEDVGPDVDAQPDADMAPDMCVPLSECPVDACGMLDDGCGGTLDCGVCDCVDGEPTEPSCGPCGLGAASCNEDDELSCTTPQVPGLESLSCDAIIYVDKGAAGGLEQGTRREPFVTLTQALDAIGQDETKTLVLLTSEGPLSEDIIVVPDGVSMVGGYSRDWLYSSTAKTTLDAGAFDTNSLSTHKALRVVGATKPMLLEGLDLRMRSADNSYRTTVGISLESVQGPLVLDRVEVLAGRGSSGSNGVVGADGRNGVPGDDAGAFVRREFPAPGSGNSPAILAECPMSVGGDGGFGGSPPSADQGGQATSPTAGQRSPLGAVGGQSGAQNISRDGQPGSDGSKGADGADGGNSNPVDAQGVLRFSFIANPGSGHSPFFAGLFGVSGRDGDDGVGGGGGGGGEWWEDGLAQDEYPGGSGGSGGHGGCGGAGGTGGEGGGSSLALAVYDSPAVVIRRSKFEGGLAGDGGNGAMGGRGGIGAVGGEGTKDTQFPQVTLANLGGDGGRGGDGGDGGMGGGGNGGHSIGALCDAPVDVDTETTFTSSDTTARGGFAGDLTTPALDGLLFDQIGCVAADP